MAADSPANTRPWERDYTITQTLVIAETPQLRVIDLTLAPGECVPWHLHPDNDDLFICLRGTFEIREVLGGDARRTTVLRALERHNVEKRVPHTAVNVSAAECQFLIVQGPGSYDFVRLPKLDARNVHAA
ncbi:MAG: cupin domain-containing protein [Burkholderiales bacterium]|nr:cupin domain-containing protein [Burkholderiales bacterium]